MITIEDIRALTPGADPTLWQYIKDAEAQELFQGNREYYVLLMSISNLVNNTTIYDIGSYRGHSAVALSSNPTNKVISYDIGNSIDLNSVPNNVEFRIGNFFENLDVLSSPLIYFDTDPHNGQLESEFVKWATNNNYKGTVLFDDINLNEKMQAFFASVTQEKYDITDIGHQSGTGVVFFR
jgi:hypothetical protein